MANKRLFGLRRVAAAVVLLAVPVVSVGATTGAASAAVPGTITIYDDPTIGGPRGIAAGPDGALWFTDGGSIGRITTGGTVTKYADPAMHATEGIAAGPDSALWFTNGNGSIGRITTAGAASFYSDASVFVPRGIAAGPDGAMWFANYDSIGRITVTGTITHYSHVSISGANGITTGPDGAMWFTNSVNDSIGRITMAGAVTNYTAATMDVPYAIAAGPDGALWFTNFATAGSIGRITTTGAVTDYTDPSINGARGIAAGPDGALWFGNAGFDDSIGRITTGGTVSHFTDPDVNTPTDIVAGSDGGMWFTNFFTDTIGRIEPGVGVLPGAASVVEGNSGYVDLVVPVTLSSPSSETVTVQWTTKFSPGAPVGQADPASDFTAASGTVTFVPGDTAESVTISINGDALVEPDEYLVVSFNHPTNAKMGGYFGLGFGLITNDDHAKVIPGGASVVEGDSGTVDLNVPVTLSNPSTQTITVDWNTGPAGAPPRADPASDFTAASGTVTFAPGETAKTVTITVNGDTDVEPNEWITVSFKNPTNATMGGFYGLGFGVITNDD